jgi:hypothetical protein
VQRLRFDEERLERLGYVRGLQALLRAINDAMAGDAVLSSRGHWHATSRIS